MKYSELLKKSPEDLQTEWRELVDKKLKLELQGRDRQTARCHRFKQYRRDIARIKTLLRQREGS